jgi:predicted nucleic acid-binding protein
MMTKNEVVIDASLLVGLIYTEDVWHSRAKVLWTTLKEAGYTCIYFDCIVGEAISASMRRLHEKKRLSDIKPLLVRLNTFVPMSSVTWILPGMQQFYPKILDLMESSGGALNFNDALIALACRERKIDMIASFDADFDQVSWLRRVTKAEEI